MKTARILQSIGAILLLGCIAVSAQTLTLKQLQDNYIAMKFGIFLHFNMSTFSEQNNVGVIEEHEEGDESNNLFAPKNLNCGQWADAVRNSGARYAVLTVKHHGGFCLWPTATTTHSVKNSTWRSGKGDVVIDFKMERAFYGLSERPVKTQIWVAICGYVNTFSRQQSRCI